MDKDSSSPARLIITIIPRIMQSLVHGMKSCENAIHPSHFRILHILQHHPLTLSEIARFLHITNATASETVDLLERKGYLQRTAAEGDHRKQPICITSCGLSKVAEIEQSLYEYMEHQLRGGTLEQYKAINLGLIELLNILDENKSHS